MTDTAAHNTTGASGVFLGLTPHGPAAQSPKARSFAARTMMNTVPLVLVGSMAAMALNLTGPVGAAEARKLPQAKPAENGPRVVKTPPAPIQMTATEPAPASYVVQDGDTISDIAERFGLGTPSVLAMNGLSWSSTIYPGQELRLAAAAPAPATPATAAPAAPEAQSSYTIAAGDTISGIAARFSVSTDDVLQANGLSRSSIIYPGQELAIPGASTPAATAPPAAAATVFSDIHTVAVGETVSSIAAARGLTTEDLLAANALGWDSVIYPGEELLLPSSAALPMVAAASVTPLNGITGLTPEMTENAAVIVRVGRELGVSDFAIAIALATAMQESSLRNLDWGDRDSVGLFQQRPSTGWGTVEDLTNPEHATRLFFGGPTGPNDGTRGLLDIAGWESMSLTEAAQAVQISAYPDYYAKWETAAWGWLDALG